MLHRCASVLWSPLLSQFSTRNKSNMQLGGRVSTRNKSNMRLGGRERHLVQLSQAALGCFQGLLQSCHVFARPPPPLEVNFLLDLSRLR